MSRFFSAIGDSESESSEEEVQEPVRRQIISYSSDEENVKRVVQPAKVKYLGELRNIIQHINNHKKIKDYTSLLSAFDELTKIYEKARNPVFSIERVPAFFVVCLADLLSFVSTAWDDTEGRKTLSKIGYKSLAALRQKLRKFSRTFEDEINDYKNNPENYEYESDPEEVVEVSVAEKVSEESQSSDFPDSDSESDSDDDTHYENIRDRFLKKAVEDEPKKKDRKEKKKKDSKNVQDEDEDGEWEMVTGNSGNLAEHKLFAKDADITSSSVLEKLKEISTLRRLKRVERLTRIERFRELYKITGQHQLGSGLKAKLKISEISALFDFNVSALEPMKGDHWDNVLQYVTELVDLLNVSEVVAGEHISEEEEDLETKPSKIRCNLADMLVRLVEEFHKILKAQDAFKNEFREKYKDDEKIGLIIDKMLNYCRKHCSRVEIAKVTLCKMEHIYYKLDPKVFDKTNKEKTSLEVMHELATYIFTHDKSQRLRTRAILMKIYHLALHNKWTTARDLFLMSNLQNLIEFADPATQILYNRALVQTGLCAFRVGNFFDAHQCISDLVTSGRVRELLGQGFSSIRNMELSHEQELRERQFQTPFHMSINLDVIDAIYLITAMLIYVPALAAQENDARRKSISKHFYLQLRVVERKNLVGPPETLREHIVAASFALKNAKWRDCLAFLINPNMMKKVWGLIAQPTDHESLLEAEVKKQGLKVYLYNYNLAYDSLSIPFLSKLFEMKVFQVESLLAGMILEEDLKATVNLSTQTVVFLKDFTKNSVQNASSQLLEKVATLLDCNERSYTPEKNMRFTNPSSRHSRFPFL